MKPRVIAVLYTGPWLLYLLSAAVCLSPIMYTKDVGNANMHRPSVGYLYRVSAKSRLECSTLCTTEASCVAFFFTINETATGNCQLHATVVDMTGAGPGVEKLPGTDHFTELSHVPFVPVCPTDDKWVFHKLPDNTVFYLKIIANGTVDRQTSINYCAEYGAYPPKIATLEKMYYFRDHVVTCPYTAAYDYHVDGDNLGASADWYAPDAWKTRDGTPIPMTVGDFWYTSRPNDPDVDHCMWISSAKNYLFDDIPCSRADLANTMCEIIA